MKIMKHEQILLLNNNNLFYYKKTTYINFKMDLYKDRLYK